MTSASPVLTVAAPPLANNHAAMLAASAISADVLAARGYRTVTTKAELARLGFSSAQQLVPALLIPVRIVTGEIALHVLRPDAPRYRKTKPVKYEFPSGAHMCLDVPTHARPGLANPSIPLWITEGSKKADAAISAGLCCVSVIGVWNWRGTNDLGGTTALADWESIALNEREVYITFDSDVMLKKSVADALARLKPFLELRKARVRLVYLPSKPDGSKVGLDDFLASGRTVDDLLALATTTLRITKEKSASGDADETDRGSTVRDTDAGNARRLVAQFGASLRFCEAWGAWIYWDGRRWATDKKGRIYRYATRTVASIFQEAIKCKELDARDLLIQHARRSESEPRLRAMITLAAKHEKVAVEPDEFDSDPWSLTVANGVVDLRTGTLHEHDRARLVTKLSPITFDPAATCPTWDRFLLAVADGREDLVSFLQRAVGYSLSGSTREHVLFFCYGTGANGKSTFLEILETLLGEFSRHADMNSFMESRSRGIRSDLARLAGARVVTASELDKDASMAEGVVKSLTGADKITASFLYQDEFDFRPQFKLWLAGNHKPRIKGSDEGIWRRIRLVPFNVRFQDPGENIPPELQKDKNLIVKLQAELPGILAWAVRGCAAWQQHGLGSCDSVAEATEEYREEQDTFGAFLAERCFLNDNARCSAKDIYDAYTDWTKATGDHGRFPWGQRRIGLTLRERGHKNIKDRFGRMWWTGIGVKSREELDAGGPGGSGSGGAKLSHLRVHQGNLLNYPPDPPDPPQPNNQADLSERRIQNDPPVPLGDAFEGDVVA